MSIVEAGGLKMGRIEKVLWICLLFGMLALAGSVVAEVDWTDEVTDPGGDVTDETGNAVEFPSADIRSVSIAEEGDFINVTMVLEVGYNSTGTYSVSISVDGSDDYYGFSRGIFPEFQVIDPSGGSVTVTGYYSDDGKRISWVVAKENITATTSLEIEYAQSLVVDFTGGALMQDNAGLGMIPTEFPVPDNMEIVLSMPKLNVLQMKVTATYKGEDGDSYRMLMDSDQDGTVTQAELDSFMDDIDMDEDTNASEANVTLDGMDPTDLDSEYSIEGAKGTVESGKDLRMIVTMKVNFPKVKDKDTHEVVFEEPFGEDFIGGDEPWENEFDMSLKFQAPDGWVFKGGSLPSKMKDYLNDDGDEVSMNTADIKKDWNNTFADLDGFTIEEADSPGFGLIVSVAAIGVIAIIVRRRR
jgi:PGF-CTERM protein